MCKKWFILTLHSTLHTNTYIYTNICQSRGLRYSEKSSNLRWRNLGETKKQILMCFITHLKHKFLNNISIRPLEVESISGSDRLLSLEWSHYVHFPQHTFWLIAAGNTQVFANNTMAPFCSSVPAENYQEPETEATKWKRKPSLSSLFTPVLSLLWKISCHV